MRGLDGFSALIEALMQATKTPDNSGMLARSG